MIISCDTSFLFSLFGNDAHSTLALEYVQNHAFSLTLTPFNYFEFYSALHLSEFRNTLSKAQTLTSITAFENNLASKVFLKAPCNLEVILMEARKFSSHYATKEGHRAFDVIHVAAARHLNAKMFLTFDKKQQSLANNLGLETPL